MYFSSVTQHHSGRPNGTCAALAAQVTAQSPAWGAGLYRKAQIACHAAGNCAKRSLNGTDTDKPGVTPVDQSHWNRNTWLQLLDSTAIGVN